MVIDDTLRGGSEEGFPVSGIDLMDPYLWRGLEESYLLDVQIATSTHTAAWLLDSRNSAGYDDFNTCVLVVRNCTNLNWGSAGPMSRTPSKFHNTTLKVHMMGEFSITRIAAEFKFSSNYFVGSTIESQGSSGALFMGNVAGLNQTPPNLGDDQELIYSDGFQNWNSDFVVGEVCRVGA